MTRSSPRLYTVIQISGSDKPNSWSLNKVESLNLFCLFVEGALMLLIINYTILSKKQQRATVIFFLLLRWLTIVAANFLILP